MVREGRLELPFRCRSWILSPVRLPVPPLSPESSPRGEPRRGHCQSAVFQGNSRPRKQLQKQQNSMIPVTCQAPNPEKLRIIPGRYKFLRALQHAPPCRQSPCTARESVVGVFSVGAWRSLVARLLWEQEVGGSNPLAPTKKAK